MKKAVGWAVLLLLGCRSTQPPKPPPVPEATLLPVLSKPVVSNGFFGLELGTSGFPESVFVRDSSGVHRVTAPRSMTPNAPGAGVPAKYVRNQKSPASIETGHYTNDLSTGVRWEPLADGTIRQTVFIQTEFPAKVTWPEVQPDDAVVPVKAPANIDVLPDHAVTIVVDWRLKGAGERASEGPAPMLSLDGDPQAADLVATGLARLSTETRAGSFGPFGMTSDRYGGRMFWDCDVYWLPALAFLDPVGAKRIAEDRLAQVPGAQKNFAAWLKAGRPVAGGKRLGPVAATPSGLMFGWEADRTGAELSTAPTRFEHHGPGSVAFGLDFARRVGLVSDEQVRPVLKGVAAFYALRMENGSLRSTVSPDEWRTVDDDLYTNEVASWVLGQSGALSRHRDGSGRLLQYVGDEGGPYQQVAGLLAAWPLQSLSDQDALGLYGRVAGRISPDGPAMSYGIHTVVAARLGKDDEAIRQWTDGWRKFSGNPIFEFREHEKVPSGYFLTGAASQINGVLYGFLGLRLDNTDPGAKGWKKQLRSGAWVSLNPRLPREWKGITATLWFDSQPFTVQANGDSVVVVPAHNGADLPKTAAAKSSK